MNMLSRCRIAAWLLMLSSGCGVQSYYPHYTAPERTSAPQLLGEWRLLEWSGEALTNKTISPWVVTDAGQTNYNVVTYDKENVPATIEVVAFQVGGQLYGDFTAGAAGEAVKLNEFWQMNLAAVHTLGKLELTNDFVRVRFLNAEWLEKALDDKQVTLPRLEPTARGEKGIGLIIATPAEWTGFLQQHGTNTAAFAEKPDLILQRHRPPERAATNAAPAKAATPQ